MTNQTAKSFVSKDGLRVAKQLRVAVLNQEKFLDGEIHDIDEYFKVQFCEEGNLLAVTENFIPDENSPFIEAYSYTEESNPETPEEPGLTVTVMIRLEWEVISALDILFVSTGRVPAGWEDICFNDFEIGYRQLTAINWDHPKRMEYLKNKFIG